MSSGSLQVFRCHRTITEEFEISFAQHGNIFSFGPSLGVSCVSKSDHFVVPVRILYRIRFKWTHLDRSLRVVILKWDVWKNDVWIIQNTLILQFHRS